MAEIIIQKSETVRPRREGATRRRVFAGGGADNAFDHKVLDVARVVRVVKGGRRFSFRASVIVGDRRGTVGLGVGKSKDVQAAIQKAYEQGVKDLKKIDFKGRTIPHPMKGKFSGSEVLIRPAKPGTGIIAGGTIRLVAEMAGINDLVSKRMGSANKLNTAKAAIQAMTSLKVTK